MGAGVAKGGFVYTRTRSVLRSYVWRRERMHCECEYVSLNGIFTLYVSSCRKVYDVDADDGDDG